MNALIGKEDMHNFDKILSYSQFKERDLMRNTIRKSHNSIRSTINELKPSGVTALGPALVSGLAFAQKVIFLLITKICSIIFRASQAQELFCALMG